MNNLTQSNRFLSVLPLVFTLFLSSCSDDSDNKTEAPQKTTEKVEKPLVVKKSASERKVEDQSHYEKMSKPVDKASWSEKGRFNKEFTKDCIARELNNAGDTKVDKQYVEKTCACIADYMDDHLTDQEAEEFLNEDSHMRALQIRYDTAAYHCVSGAKKVSEPKVTRFQ